MTPENHFAKNDDASIAYQVLGGGLGNLRLIIRGLGMKIGISLS